MYCLHKTHKVRLLILLDKNFLQEKAKRKTAERGHIFVGFGADMVIFCIEKQKNT